MESGIISVPNPAFRDPDFDPVRCADSLDFLAFTLKQAASQGVRMEQEAWAEVLETSAELIRYAHTWVVEQAKTDGFE